MEVYLVRHGESTANVEGIFSGHMDVELTKGGEDQADAISESLSHIEFDAVYSSDLKRALKTAELATKGRFEIVTSRGLREMSFGIFEGKSLQDLEAEGTEEFLIWSKDYVNNIVPGGESIVTSGERVVEYYKDIIHNSLKKGYERIIIFAHLGPIKAILANEISGDLKKHFKYKVENCGINIIEYDVKGQSSLVCLNAKKL